MRRNMMLRNPILLVLCDDLIGVGDQCPNNHVISACAVTSSVHDSHVISACSVT